MSKTALIENQWVDIVLPPPPESQVLIWWLLSIGLIIVITFITRIVWQQQPKQRLKRSIHLLLRNLTHKNNSENSKQILQKLEKALCQFCNTNQLRNIKINHSQWPAFREQLQLSTYQAIEPERKHIHDLLKQAQSIFLGLKVGGYK